MPDLILLGKWTALSTLLHAPCGLLHKASLMLLFGLQIKLSNPSKTPLTYSAKLVGEDACDFTLPRGEQMTVGARGSLQVAVQFISRFLRPARAVLVLVGRRYGASVGTTLVFTLTTAIDNISPKVSSQATCHYGGF
jgi:hypothetical protein